MALKQRVLKNFEIIGKVRDTTLVRYGQTYFQILSTGALKRLEGIVSIFPDGRIRVREKDRVKIIKVKKLKTEELKRAEAQLEKAKAALAQARKIHIETRKFAKKKAEELEERERELEMRKIQLMSEESKLRAQQAVIADQKAQVERMKKLSPIKRKKKRRPRVI